jgi:hypothetical protein
METLIYQQNCQMMTRKLGTTDSKYGCNIYARFIFSFKIDMKVCAEFKWPVIERR